MEHCNENHSNWQKDPGLSGHMVGTPDLVPFSPSIFSIWAQPPSLLPETHLPSSTWPPIALSPLSSPACYAMSAGINPLPMLGTQGTNHHSANCNAPGLQNKKTRKEKLKSIVLLANSQRKLLEKSNLFLAILWLCKQKHSVVYQAPIFACICSEDQCISLGESWCWGRVGGRPAQLG